MARGHKLDTDEKKIVKMLYFKHKSCQEIADILERDRGIIRYYIAELKGAIRKPRLGRARKLSTYTEQAIGRRASNATTSSNEIIGELGLHVSKSTVQRSIRRCWFIKREKKLRCQLLSKKHKTVRLAACRQRRLWTNEWSRMIFSDEKKWNLDGPDNDCYYYHDIRKPKVSHGRRQAGGGSVMSWAAFGCFGKTPMVYTTGTQKAVDYQDTLDEHLAPVFDDLAVHPSIFMQDGASIHTAGSTMRWFADRHVLRLPWTSRSPDLNPMENLWAIVSEQVYHNGKIYYHAADLKVAVTAAWNAVPVSTLNNLILRMPRRMQAVIAAKGGNTKY